MSIKSQKSLYDECSEIVERSYSVRSASEESLSCSDEDECLARQLLHKLTPAMLSQLRRRFSASKDKNDANDIDRRVEEVMRAAAAEEGIEFAASGERAREHDERCLDERGFVDAIDDIFGHHRYTPHARQLFRALAPLGAGRARWGALVERLAAAGARRLAPRATRWTPARDAGVRRLKHCKRETIVKLVSVETQESFCYVAVSRGGRVGVYSGQLALLHSYEVFYHRTGVSRRVKNCWITDAVYLSDVQCVIYSASDRSLTVYDVSTLTHAPVYCITGMPNIPTCMSYSAEVATLAVGGARGDVTRVRFLRPRTALLPARGASYCWRELSSAPLTAYCAVSRWRGVHARGARRVRVCARGAASCAHDARASVRVRRVRPDLPDYVFAVQRGVSCFHVIPSLHLVATGSADGVVRLWEMTQSSPFASLACPAQAAVLDVAVLVARDLVVAYCNNCWFHIWDMYEECLLQTIKIKFPFLGVLGKKVEFGAYCIHPGPARQKLCDEATPDASSDPPELSRRSSVYPGSTGGLLLQPEESDSCHDRGVEDDPEYIRYNRPELLITCCDYVCVITLNSDEVGALLPPPGDTLRARRPSFWDLPDDVFKGSASSPPPPATASLPIPLAPSSRFLSPSTAENPHHDLDSLLENAGLQGILEKDFVLMQGLKHDLNRKLADMEANMDAMTAAVSVGAPYLALKVSEPAPLTAVDEMTDRYRKVMKLFPASSSAGTPTGSGTSTPRKKSLQLSGRT